MTYLENHKSKNKWRTITIVIITVVFVIAWALIQWLAPHLFSAASNAVARPFWRANFAIMNGALKSPQQLLNENEALRRQLSDMSIRLATVRGLEIENAELKALLNRSDGDVNKISTSTFILAAVLAKPPVAIYDELIIDIGHDYNLATTSGVYAPGNVLIGRVIEVGDNTSKVLLFSSPGEKYNVLIGEGNFPAEAIGRGGGQYEAKLPRGADINKDDLVTVPSINNKQIGIVSSVISDPTQSFEKILFAPPVNIYQLKWVMVDTKGFLRN